MRKKNLVIVILLVILFNARASYGASNNNNNNIVRMGVMKFLNRAEGVTDQQAAAVGDIFARMLTNSKSIAVIERDQLEAIASEHRLSVSGLVDADSAVRIGKIAGCQYMLLGAVTNLAKKGTQTNLWLWGQTNQEATATIDVRVVDVETTEVILSLSETGKSSQSGSTFNFYGMTNETVDLAGMEAGAIAEATSKLGFKIREALTGEYPQVLTAGGRDITLNVGATSGAQKGAYWRVYTDGEEIHDVDGTLLGRKMNNIAIVRIAEVQTDFSIANIPEGGGKAEVVRRGDKIQPITQSDAKDLIKQKAFPKERPRQRLGEDFDEYLSSSSNAIQKSETKPAEISVKENKANKKLENESTDPGKVIASYGLPSGETNLRRLAHVNAKKAGTKSKRAYDKYVELANSYDGDYLAAYQAGVIAQNLNMRSEALKWYDKALEINPDYEPAKIAKTKLVSRKK